MTLAELTDGFAALEAELAEERGPFNFFALFMREEVPDRWDLIVAAPWMEKNKQAVVADLVERIRNRLGEEALILLSRIVVVDPENEAVRRLTKVINVEHGGVDIKDSNIFGLDVKHAHIVTSKRPPARAAG